ncbi:hypothetical protein EMIT0P260_70075 [Pseudomonas sp. IT-P260]
MIVVAFPLVCRTYPISLLEPWEFMRPLIYLS